jgi:hypothetical protein
MTALSGNHDPTVGFDYTQNFSNSHSSAFHGFPRRTLILGGYRRITGILQVEQDFQNDMVPQPPVQRFKSASIAAESRRYSNEACSWSQTFYFNLSLGGITTGRSVTLAPKQSALQELFGKEHWPFHMGIRHHPSETIKLF